jgi:altronate hydrolase
MDVDAGEILSKGISVEEKGREIYEMFLRVASGEVTKSEGQGLGNYEFVPWQIGAVM